MRICLCVLDAELQLRIVAVSASLCECFKGMDVIKTCSTLCETRSVLFWFFFSTLVGTSHVQLIQM